VLLQARPAYILRALFAPGPNPPGAEFSAKAASGEVGAPVTVWAPRPLESNGAWRAALLQS